MFQFEKPDYNFQEYLENSKKDIQKIINYLQGFIDKTQTKAVFHKALVDRVSYMLFVTNSFTSNHYQSVDKDLKEADFIDEALESIINLQVDVTDKNYIKALEVAKSIESIIEKYSKG